MASIQQTLAVREYLEREVTREQRNGRTDQALCTVLSDFYARFTVEEIPAILSQWSLAARIGQSPDHPVWLTADGVKWFHEVKPIQTAP